MANITPWVISEVDHQKAPANSTMASQAPVSQPSEISAEHLFGVLFWQKSARAFDKRETLAKLQDEGGKILLSPALLFPANAD